MKESVLQCMIIGEDVEPIFYRFEVREPCEWLKHASMGTPSFSDPSANHLCPYYLDRSHRHATHSPRHLSFSCRLRGPLYVHLLLFHPDRPDQGNIPEISVAICAVKPYLLAHRVNLLKSNLIFILY